MSKLPVGTRARILRVRTGHQFKTGDIVYKIWSVIDPDDSDLWSTDKSKIGSVRDGGGDCWYVTEKGSSCEIEVLSLDVLNYEIC